MSNAGKILQVRIDGTQTFQRIDGFGVNINAKYWDGAKLLPAMEMLLGDLGATLYRVDIWGKSDWIDPDGTLGKAALHPDHLSAVYQGDIFQRGWGLMRYLNEHGIEPYLTASGDVCAWMLGLDGRTLVDYESFCEMLVSMLEWARRKENLRFRYFGPLNETDVGQPEGPLVSPKEYVKVCELIDKKLAQRGLDDIRLVVAEQADFNPAYVREFVSCPGLQPRIGAFSLHDYSDFAPSQYQEVTGVVQQTPYAKIPFWMGEYGDLEQSGEREWYVAWAMTSRLFDQLRAGFRAALVWDAFDNLHDHDGAWTIYGLLRSGLRVYTPKKRYYASKQVFRFVPPGFERIGVAADSADVRVVAFANPERTQMTLVGMNCSSRFYELNAILDGFAPQVKVVRTGGWRTGSTLVTYYRTSESENCFTVGRSLIHGSNNPFTGLEAHIPPDCIFTLTTVPPAD